MVLRSSVAPRLSGRLLKLLTGEGCGEGTLTSPDAGQNDSQRLELVSQHEAPLIRLGDLTIMIETAMTHLLTIESILPLEYNKPVCLTRQFIIGLLQPTNSPTTPSSTCFEIIKVHKQLISAILFSSGADSNCLYLKIVVI